MTDTPSPGADLAHLLTVGQQPAATPSPADANRAAAATRLEFLKNDSEFARRHLGGTPAEQAATRAEIEKLATIIAMPREGTTMHGGPTTEAQRADAADTLANGNLGLSEAHLQEVRNGTPNSPAIYAEAMRMKRALMSSPDWRAKYMSADPDARRQMTLINIIESNPVSA
jgi:hypothetical protein